MHEVILNLSKYKLLCFEMGMIRNRNFTYFVSFEEFNLPYPTQENKSESCLGYSGWPGPLMLNTKLTENLAPLVYQNTQVGKKHLRKAVDVP